MADDDSVNFYKLIHEEAKVTKGKESVVNIQWRYNSDWRKFRVTIQKKKVK
jgi:hypothetical protein